MRLLSEDDELSDARGLGYFQHKYADPETRELGRRTCLARVSILCWSNWSASLLCTSIGTYRTLCILSCGMLCAFVAQCKLGCPKGVAGPYPVQHAHSSSEGDMAIRETRERVRCVGRRAVWPFEFTTVRVESRAASVTPVLRLSSFFR